MKPLDRFEVDIRMFDQGLAEFLEAYKNIENEYQKLLNDYSNHVEEMKKLLIEVEELREYKKNATRKYWQEQSANNYLNWRMAENKIEDIKEFIYYNIIDGELDLNKRRVIELKELLEKPANIEMFK